MDFDSEGFRTSMRSMTNPSVVGGSRRNTSTRVADSTIKETPSSRDTLPGKEDRGIVRRWFSKAFRFCEVLADSQRLSALTTLLTIYVLVGDDIRLGFTTNDTDPIFDVLSGISLAFFALELFVASVAKPGYFMSFFMVLDAIATVTIVFDFSVVQAAMTGGGEVGAESGQADTSIARASRASRAGTKAARVVRIIRLIRLVRIVKLYKASLDRKDKEDMVMEDLEEFEQGIGSGEQSRVGKKLSEQTTKKVIMIVLGMMLFVPFFEFNYFSDDDALSKQIGADIMMDNFVEWIKTNEKYQSGALNNDLAVRQTRETFEDSMLLYFYYHNPHFKADDCEDELWFCVADFYNRVMWVGSSPEIASDLPVVQIPKETWNDRFYPTKEGEQWLYATGTFPPEVLNDLSQPFSLDCTLPGIGTAWGMSFALNNPDYSIRCPSDLRSMERDFVFGSHSYQGKNYMMLIYFDMRTTSRNSAGFNVLTTVFICMILWYGSMTFSKVSDTLVLHPLERMIERVEKIKENPMEAIWASESLTMIEHYDGPEKKSLLQGFFHFLRPTMLGKFIERRRGEAKAVAPPMETVMLEKTIIKIGGLMALGFGEAGMEIICQNMQGANSSNLNAMIPGHKMNAVFGYCDIRNFTDTTEILKDEVMVFVNKISAVIHPIVDDFLGAPNKNVGDSFLLVWRFEDQSGGPTIVKICDLALMAICRIVAQLTKNPDLRAYRHHAELCAAVPNYSVKIGFGVHVGWAIEGAIGSEFKIDASYLSPHVNTTCTLEAATKAYRVNILLSSCFVVLLSANMRAVCRLIDHVSVHGYTGSLRLYTVDLDLNSLDAAADRENQRFKTKELKTMNFLERNECKQKKLKASYDVYEHFTADEDISKMRLRHSSPAFLRKFQMGMLNYESGEWATAKNFFEFTLLCLKGEKDGPSEVLLEYMKKFNFEIGKEWPGYRELKE